nr:AUGMIN subunit 4-like [Ipomoea batatas]
MMKELSNGAWAREEMRKERPHYLEAWAWEEMMKEGQHYFEALVLEQILGVVIKLVKDIKLQHQNKYLFMNHSFMIKGRKERRREQRAMSKRNAGIELKKLETMKGQTLLLEQSLNFGVSSSKIYETLIMREWQRPSLVKINVDRVREAYLSSENDVGTIMFVYVL